MSSPSGVERNLTLTISVLSLEKLVEIKGRDLKIQKHSGTDQ
jgi:hypothetical protein